MLIKKNAKIKCKHRTKWTRSIYFFSASCAQCLFMLSWKYAFFSISTDVPSNLIRFRSITHNVRLHMMLYECVITFSSHFSHIKFRKMRFITRSLLPYSSHTLLHLFSFKMSFFFLIQCKKISHLQKLQSYRHRHGKKKLSILWVESNA